MPFLAQLAALFTGDTDSVIQDAPDDATLDTLTDGVWRISSAAHNSLGIPKDTYSASPPGGSQAEFYPGGILFLCTLSDIMQFFTQVVHAATVSGGYVSLKAPARFALFISISKCRFWFTSRRVTEKSVYIDTSNGSTTNVTYSYRWLNWSHVGGQNGPTTTFCQYPISRGTFTLTSSVTATEEAPLCVAAFVTAPNPLPVSSGLVYGPNCARASVITTYKGSMSAGAVGTNTGGNTALVVTSGTFPAGTYIVEMYCETFS